MFLAQRQDGFVVMKELRWPLAEAPLERSNASASQDHGNTSCKQNPLW